MQRGRNFLALRWTALGIALTVLSPMPVRTQGDVPGYEVDTSWPKPMPERWVVGPLGGRVWTLRTTSVLLHRQALLDVDLDAGQKAPPVIELDPEGNVVNTWTDGLSTRH